MKFEHPLKVLAAGGVTFVIVGGVAMNLQGSALNTTDLDLVYDRERENVRRLVAALLPYSPRLRGAPPNVRFRFDETSIRNGLNFTLATDIGDIDLFGELSGVGGFEAVKKLSKRIRLGRHDFWILSLRGLIKVKRATGRPKDRFVIPELEALAEVEERTELPN